MKVKEMIEKLDLKLLTKDVSEDALYAEVEGGYASDLLSCFSILCLSSTLSIYTSKKFVFIIFPNSLIAV